MVREASGINDAEAFRNSAFSTLIRLYCFQNGLRMKSAEAILPDGRTETIRKNGRWLSAGQN
jgi:hypothetical protein